MIDLNSKQFNQVSKIFNNGIAGKVDNTTVTVEKKQVGEPETYPDYKLVVKDEMGQTLNAGFYYPKANSNKTQEENDKRANMEVSRVVHIARAVVGENYEFPAVSTAKDAFDTLFKIVKDEAGDKKFSVFATYGAKGYPSKYLGLRYFNFIEPTDITTSRLKVTPNDVMERIEADSPISGGNSTSSSEDNGWV